MSLQADIYRDIAAWLNRNEEIIANERDLQVELASALRQNGAYDKVHLEYRIPENFLKERIAAAGIIANVREKNPVQFPWLNSSNYFIDIVVEKDNKFFPVELKYATRSIDNACRIFDNDASESLLSDKAACDIIMYHFWKDVRRLEVLSKLFDNVVGGISLLIANPKVYYEAPRRLSGYKQFSTHEGNRVGEGLLSWEDKMGNFVKDKYPRFLLDGSYVCRWEKMPVKATRKGKEEIFKYLLINIA